jgi:[heparan sulfate]-glucosamine 3-sulfotransferase 3
MEILISKKVILALITLAAISFYISYTFNTCLVSSIAKALPKWRHHPVVPNGDTVIHYRTSVRVVPLLEGNESDISPKYKFFREQGLRPMRQLPSALIIGTVPTPFAFFFFVLQKRFLLKTRTSKTLFT